MNEGRSLTTYIATYSINVLVTVRSIGEFTIFYALNGGGGDIPCSHFAVMNGIQNLYDGNISILKKAALGSGSWPRLLWLP